MKFIPYTLLLLTIFLYKSQEHLTENKRFKISTKENTTVIYENDLPLIQLTDNDYDGKYDDMIFYNKNQTQIDINLDGEWDLVTTSEDVYKNNEGKWELVHKIKHKGNNKYDRNKLPALP